MKIPTKIEWTHIPGFKGETWNPVTGCIKVSPGCTHCYAEAITKRFKLGGPFMPGQTTITCHEDRVNIPLHWSKPRCVFTCSMSDLFQDGVPAEFIKRCFLNMALSPEHLFLVLTKRPARMAEVLDDEFGQMIESLGVNWPLDNVWGGTSVENQTWVDRRIPELLAAPFVVHFVSAEPLLREIDLSRYLNPFGYLNDHTINMVNHGVQAGRIDLDDWRQPTVKWVIVGGESGPGHRPMLVPWVGKLRDQCRVMAVPFFLKQWGGARPGGEALIDGVAIREWPIPKNAPTSSLFGRDDRR